MTLEERAAYAKKWYVANREKAIAIARNWQKRNPNKKKATNKKWREKNLEKINQDDAAGEELKLVITKGHHLSTNEQNSNFNDTDNNNINPKNQQEQLGARHLLNPLYFLPYAICHLADSTHQVLKMKVCFLPSVTSTKLCFSSNSASSSGLLSVKLFTEPKFLRVVATPAAWKHASLSLSAS